MIIKKFYALLFTLLALTFLVPQVSWAQNEGVSISASGIPALEPTAILQLNSTEKGFIVPRMTYAQRDAINPPGTVKGLMVYQTEAPEGYYYWDGARWLYMAATAGAGFVENRAVDNNFATGQSASFNLVGSGELGGTLSVGSDINSATGFKIGNTAPVGQYLRGNGTRFVSSAIQVSDLPSAGQITVAASGVGLSISGSPVALGGTVTVTSNATASNAANTIVSRDASGNFNAGLITANLDGQWKAIDDRIIEPNAITSGYAKFGFTSYDNNNTAPWADFLHLRSYTDGSGGNDNMIVLNRSTIAMRVYQQTWNSATPYSTYKTVAFMEDLPTFSGLANPSATIGLTAVNGTATTALRSDGAPALSQAIVPTWTGMHTFSNGTYSALFTGGNVGIGIATPARKLDINGTTRMRDWLSFGASDDQGRITWGGDRFYMNGFSGKKLSLGSNAAVDQVLIDLNGNVGINQTSPTVKLEVGGDILRTSTRVSSVQRYPLGHSSGDDLLGIDPTWTDAELQAFFGNANVAWNADATAPSGWSIKVTGAVSVGGPYNSGFAYIPIEDGATYYMECWIRHESASSRHYMGSADYNAAFGSLGGNPGSYGYWTMSNTLVGTGWTKVTGYISGYGTATGQFKVNSKYWTPLALFNYSGGGNCFVSGWKVTKIAAANGTTTTNFIQNQVAAAQPAGFRVNGNGLFDGGSVGIGDVNPNAPLTVKAASTTDQALIQSWRYQPNSDTYTLKLKQTVTSGVVRYTYDMVNNNTAYNNMLTFDRGNVGIATTDPTQKLDVNGQIRLRGGSPDDGKVLMATSSNGTATWSNTPNIKSPVSTFTVDGNFSEYYPVVFYDAGWDDGPMELELIRSNVHTNSSWRGSLQSRFFAHGTNYGHGAQFVDAQIHYGTNTFIAGYTHDPRTRNFIVWLRGGGTTYTMRTNNLTTVTDFAATAKTIGIYTYAVKTGVDSYVQSIGRQFQGNIGATGLAGTGDRPVFVDADGKLQAGTTAPGSSPIGTITAWHKNMPGTPGLPTGWVECNGQTLSDSESPYNGQVIPNLNSTASSTFGGSAGGRYLRGSTTSGSLQADRAPNFQIEQSATDQGSNSGTVNDGATQNYSPWMNNYYSSDSFRWRYVGGEVRPVSMTVVYIMRVK